MSVRFSFLCLRMLTLSQYLIHTVAFFEIRTRLMKMKIYAVLNALHVQIKHPSKVTNSRFSTRLAANGNTFDLIGVLFQKGRILMCST